MNNPEKPTSPHTTVQLYRNRYKRPGSKAPDFTGPITLGGVEYRLACWRNIARTGEEYLAIRFEDETDATPAAQDTARGETWPCPCCGNRPVPTCRLCRGGGRFNPALLSWLRTRRRERRISDQEMADELGVSSTTFLKMETGVNLTAYSFGQRQAAGQLLLRYLKLLAVESDWFGEG